ncbi:MAG: hypothetical protein ACRDNZ_17745, partial [Streptosporangiaceae bacterium]
MRPASRAWRPETPAEAAPLAPEALRELAGIVGAEHVLTGAAAAGYASDWTGKFRGATPAVVRPADTAAVAAVLAWCTRA